MTTMKDALHAAGVISPSERLRAVAVAALVASNNNWDGAKDELFKSVQNDAGLLWALFEPYRMVAAQKLLTEVMAEMRASAKVERGHGNAANHGNAAPLNRTNGAQHAAKPSGSGQTFVDNHGRYARPAPSPRPPAGERIIQSTNNTRAPVRDPRAGIEARIAVARASMLDLFKVNGQAIGDMTAREAIGWAGSRERDARFVRLLTQNLPADLPIRKFRTAEEADAIYERAAEMSDA